MEHRDHVVNRVLAPKRLRYPIPHTGQDWLVLGDLPIDVGDVDQLLLVPVIDVDREELVVLVFLWFR